MDGLRLALMLGPIAAILAACGEPAPPVRVPFRLVSAPGDDPFASAATLDIRIERAGEVLAEQSFPAAERTFGLGPFGFGRDFGIRVEVLDPRDVSLAFGRSFPFDVQPGRQAPAPDVFVGVRGRFVSPGPDRPGDAVSAVIPTGDGAMVVTASGDLYAYRQHGHEDGTPSFELVTSTLRRNAAWVGLGGSALFAFGGTALAAAAFDLQGNLISDLGSTELADQKEGAAVVARSTGSAAVLVGGSRGALRPVSQAVTRIVLEGGTLRAEPAQPLPVALQDAQAVEVFVTGDDGSLLPRIAVVGGRDRDGGPSSWALLIDPDGAAPPLSIVLPSGLRDGFAVTPVGPGLVLVVGGLGADGMPRRDLFLMSALAHSFQLVSPSPDPLPEPRTSAAAVSIGSGLALVLGGRGTDDVPLESAVVVDVSVDVFPGRPVPTGSLPRALAAPHAAALGDGSVLAADQQGLALYVPQLHM